MPILERRAPADNVADLSAGGDWELSKQGKLWTVLPKIEAALGDVKDLNKNECLSSDTRFLFNNLSSRADYVPGALSPYWNVTMQNFRNSTEILLFW